MKGRKATEELGASWPLLPENAYCYWAVYCHTQSAKGSRASCRIDELPGKAFCRLTNSPNLGRRIQEPNLGSVLKCKISRTNQGELASNTQSQKTFSVPGEVAPGLGLERVESLAPRPWLASVSDT